MGTEFMEIVERMRGKKLTGEEKDMFIRMREELRCSDEDAIWKLVAVLEYQKTFYLDLPEIITRKAEKLCMDIGKAAEKEVALAQGKLAESVVEQAKNLNLKSKLSTLVLIGLFALVLFFLTCSLMMWAGYRIGTGGSQMPEIMFRMPSGLMIGLLLLGCAGIFSYWAAKEYADEKKTLWRPLAGAAISTILGGLTFTVSL